MILRYAKKAEMKENRRKKMGKKVCVFLAEGFEEIEGLTVVDLMRRADVEVTTVSIGASGTVRGAHGIGVIADRLFEEMDFDGVDMLVLPGGMPGTVHLAEHRGLQSLLMEYNRNGRYLAAICAAPTVFGKLGFLQGRKAVCYQGMEDGLCGADVLECPVVVDGHIITSRGLGTAIDFALALIELLEGKEKAEHIEQSVMYHK